ncbi:ABC transporter permease [Thermotoga neapolitana]|uniref:Spermidine/putrescine ABC transporter, permease protein n=1 Tax=Thermotoga neapolitana (strain ATCC 49049 / DSM 4359 / NBRC 107923 / NS-E) TaxID=309803 RepID=B9K8V6_THENN|nr:ABC transporter permease [Thermotoga neapolitana]ACM23389.1 Spermidine/putrescine ABC transporter, permease protein [Thermotoga neapolitana DSM 4359]KFZ21522.1 spermidine/putrescine ABC transporter permease [Thermotoga neapolitana LA10]HBF11242.1 ABC transporter permease [Thermotoga neapolitana]
MTPGRFIKTVTALTMVFFYLPLVIVIIMSFNAAKSPAWAGFTLRWYVELFTREYSVWNSFKNSLIVAIVSSVIATFIGTVTAVELYWKKTRVENTIWFLTYLPFVVPDVIIGISLLLLFSMLRMQLGLFTIILAHITFSIPYTMMIVYSRLQDFDKNIIEAAYDLGSTDFQVFYRVIIPNLVPGIVAAFLLAFTLSIDDFVITFFVAGPGSTTLPIQIYSMIRFGISPTVNAISTFMIVGTIFLGFILRKFVKYIF